MGWTSRAMHLKLSENSDFSRATWIGGGVGGSGGDGDGTVSIYRLLAMTM
jgi:hypothetical protein